MKIQPLRAFRSTIGLRTMAQFAAVALLPIAALAAVLYAQAGLTPAIVDALGISAGVATVVALGLGVLQSEAFVRRIDRLMLSTRRIAKQDFSALVPEDGSDEVAELSRAFNDMARNLGTSLSVQGILAQMDDAILTKLDVGALIRSALRCMRHVTQADVVVLGLFESDTAQAMRVFVMQKGERSRIDSEKLEMRADLKRRIPLKPTPGTAPVSPFPEDFEARLREKCGIGHFYAVPISRGSRAWGVMVSCHAEAVQLNSSQVKTLNGVSNRLIAGFSGSERDQKLHSLAYVDPLTGLPNRVAMQSLLSQELGNAQRSKAMAAILFIDLDRFKQANDTHGHAFGDRLLIQAANRIRNNVREDDIVARIGGDEFTVILPDVKNPREAASVARKLIQSLSRRFEIDGHTIYTGASVGIAMYPDDGVRGPELLKMADTAMYRAKSAGRSRFAFYEEPMNAESKRRTVLDGELRNALERSELVLHYQPQIDLKTGALCGVEALVRWQHPTRGLLFPRDFIEYAEEIGLIPEIGGWVMAEACRQFQQWREDGVRVPRVSVNVSNGQLPRTNFVPTVQQLIAATNMPPGSLEIEVTESMLVEGGKPAIEALNQLSKDGVLIAIDDFGTGYSSFSYLKTMPAQVLKLDMSFLVDAREDNDAGKIVAAIINMAHALQKEVVAEGIERVDQLKLLKTLGCERGQGYLFGKGVPAENIARTFRKIPQSEPAVPRLPEAAAGAAPVPAMTTVATATAARAASPAVVPGSPVAPASVPFPAPPAVGGATAAAPSVAGPIVVSPAAATAATTAATTATATAAPATAAPAAAVPAVAPAASAAAPAVTSAIAPPPVAAAGADVAAAADTDAGSETVSPILLPVSEAAVAAVDAPAAPAAAAAATPALPVIVVEAVERPVEDSADDFANDSADTFAREFGAEAGADGLDNILSLEPSESIEILSPEAALALEEFVAGHAALIPEHGGPAEQHVVTGDAPVGGAAEVEFDFLADHAVSYAAEFAETLAAHRADDDAVLPAVAFAAIAPALPGEGHRPAAAPVAPVEDSVGNTWPPILDLEGIPTGNSFADAAPAAAPVTAALRLQQTDPATAHHH